MKLGSRLYISVGYYILLFRGLTFIEQHINIALIQNKSYRQSSEKKQKKMNTIREAILTLESLEFIH